MYDPLVIASRPNVQCVRCSKTWNHKECRGSDQGLLCSDPQCDGIVVPIAFGEDEDL